MSASQRTPENRTTLHAAFYIATHTPRRSPPHPCTTSTPTSHLIPLSMTYTPSRSPGPSAAVPHCPVKGQDTLQHHQSKGKLYITLPKCRLVAFLSCVYVCVENGKELVILGLEPRTTALLYNKRLLVLICYTGLSTVAMPRVSLIFYLRIQPVKGPKLCRRQSGPGLRTVVSYRCYPF